jgi:hypothetical protein
MGSDWTWIKALDWNEDGFNFIIDQELNCLNALFKKGLYKFEGFIMWGKRMDDEGVIMETILNTILFQEVEKISQNEQIVQRILNLIRTEGKIEEKEKVLSSLNRIVTDDEAERMVKKHLSEEPSFRYGVRVESQEWAEVVKHSLETSSVILTFDKIGKELSKMSE